MTATLETSTDPSLANPMGLDGFEFIEFSAPEKGLLEKTFLAMGFTKVARHRSKDVELWRQGGINLITNYEADHPAGHFCREHGPSACGMAFRVQDAKAAYERALKLGAEKVPMTVGPMELSIPAIRGIGGGLIYFVDRYGDDLSIYDIDFIYLEDQVEMAQKMRDITELPLNEKQRLADRTEREQHALFIENKRRTARGEELLSSWEEDEPDEADALASTIAEDGELIDEDTEDDEDIDVLLGEAGHVLVDTLLLKQQRYADNK